MPRTFRSVDHETALDLTVRLGDCLAPTHLARFVVDTLAQLDLSALYARYGKRGGVSYAPELLLGLLFYGYATGVFSSRKLERATYESIPFRFLAGNLHPDHEPVMATEPPMLQLHWWTGDVFVTHTTVFEPPTGRIEIARMVSDWESTKERIKQGPPFAKGGPFG